MVAGIFIMLAVYFNLQFLQGSNVNYGFSAHDEYLTVREVYSILHPLSAKHFFMAIISGDILYYGRFMFYTDALVAFLPFKLFGLSGLVFAVRMFHSLLLLGGIWILGKTFLKDEFHRLVFMLTALFTYYSFYFSAVPKPEPHQLLVLALFLKYFFNQDFKPDKYFILLGLAYGIKFNVLLIIPLILVWIWLHKKLTIKGSFSGAWWFLAGLLIAVPCLILSPVKPVFLKSYLTATIWNTTNVDDNAAFGPAEWLGYVWPVFYSAGFWIFMLIMLTSIGLVVYKNKSKLNAWINDPGVFMICAGIALNLPVVFTTKRLYPHYLWTGQIFIWLGILHVLSYSDIKISLKYLLSLLILCSGVTYTFKMFDNMLNREKEAQSLINAASMEYKVIFGENPRALVVQDISVYYPFEWHVQAKPYHPFAGNNPAGAPERNILWTSVIDTLTLLERNPDRILLGRAFTEKIRKPEHKADSLLLNFMSGKYIITRDSGELMVWSRK